RRRRGGLGRGALPRAPSSRPKNTPSQPPPCPLRGQRGGDKRRAREGGGRHAPSLAPQAQGRVGEGCSSRAPSSRPQSTPSQPPPCPLRGQRGGDKRRARRGGDALSHQAGRGRAGDGAQACCSAPRDAYG